uniref:Uncharacterized protein n=1 Tax=Ixodes ricinus TaxID=34613 RepID=A0A6B0U9P8_IXORI
MLCLQPHCGQMKSTRGEKATSSAEGRTLARARYFFSDFDCALDEVRPKVESSCCRCVPTEFLTFNTRLTVRPFFKVSRHTGLTIQ